MAELEIEDVIVKILDERCSDEGRTDRALAVVVKNLHSRVVEELGGSHWTAAALMDLHYRFDPTVTGFDMALWGEASAEWLLLAIPTAPYLSGMKTYSLGSGLVNSRQRMLEMTGMRCWHKCFAFCRAFWGGEHEVVQVK